jgi:hypothetical protein
MPDPKCWHNWGFKLVPRLGNASICSHLMFRNKWYFTVITELHVMLLGFLTSFLRSAEPYTFSIPCTQRQAWELISGPCLGAKARFLSFNRTLSRAVTGFLTGHNTLRRLLHLLGLLDSPLCRSKGRDLGPHSLWLWSFGLIQTRVLGLLFLGTRGHQEYKFGGHLEL